MKNLIHEMHRRSLWQVLGIYAAGSWVALEIVAQLAESLALPQWVDPFAVVLLVIGFPIVMATAFVSAAGATAPGFGGRAIVLSQRNDNFSPFLQSPSCTLTGLTVTNGPTARPLFSAGEFLATSLTIIPPWAPISRNSAISLVNACRVIPSQA